MDKVDDFIAALESEQKRADARQLLSILEKASGYVPRLTGSIIGFGSYHYKYESGREGDSPVIAFSPRKQNLVVYIMPGFTNVETLLENLGKFKLGKSCLYINKLADVDLDVLEKIAAASVKQMHKKYDCTEVV